MPLSASDCNSLQSTPMSIANTLACPAQADETIVIQSVADLIRFSQSEKAMLKRQFIGQATNVLLPAHFNGCYLLNQLEHFSPKIERLKHDKVLVTYPGSMSWHECIKFSVINGFWGGENLALIPGLASAAPVQNIGAYGVQLEDLNPRIWGVDVSKEQHSEKTAIQKFSASQAQFGYRQSIFNKELKNKFFITKIALEFSLRPNPILHYQGLQDYFSSQTTTPTLQKIMQAVIEVRQQRLPDPAIEPNAGSTFKNPIISEATFKDLQQSFPELIANEVHVNEQTKYKLFAAQLIELAGLKGHSNEHGVQVSEHHALVVTNPKGATGDKVLQLMQEIQNAVTDKFAINLIPEIEVV